MRPVLAGPLRKRPRLKVKAAVPLSPCLAKEHIMAKSFIFNNL